MGWGTRPEERLMPGYHVERNPLSRASASTARTVRLDPRQLLCLLICLLEMRVLLDLSL